MFRLSVLTALCVPVVPAQSALIRACTEGHEECVRLLLTAGANVNAINQDRVVRLS